MGRNRNFVSTSLPERILPFHCQLYCEVYFPKRMRSVLLMHSIYSSRSRSSQRKSRVRSLSSIFPSMEPNARSLMSFTKPTAWPLVYPFPPLTTASASIRYTSASLKTGKSVLAPPPSPQKLAGPPSSVRLVHLHTRYPVEASSWADISLLRGVSLYPVVLS